jgi:hypothetical protein
MTELFAQVNGHALQAVTLTVGNIGPWVAEVDFVESPELSGAVTLKLGALELRGTIVAAHDGTFGLQRRSRIVAGAGKWGSELPAKNYHNDAGVKALTVAQDAARELGETLGAFVPAAERIGNDYARELGSGSRVLEDVLGGVAWWVDYSGVTQAGSRPAAAVDKSVYEVLAFDPRTKVATLAVDDPGAVGIGSIISERLDALQTVRELELRVTADEIRMRVWCGGGETEHGRLAGLLKSIVARATDGLLLAKYRYRVVRMNGDRVELQAVSKEAGLPDVMPVSMWPGVAGAHAELAPGAVVLVEFIEGDRALPIVTHFAGQDGTGFVPVSLALCGGTQAVARQGDLVQSGGPGTTVVLTGPAVAPDGGLLVGTPYAITFSANPADIGPLQKPLYGAISTGSPKVKA